MHISSFSLPVSSLSLVKTEASDFGKTVTMTQFQLSLRGDGNVDIHQISRKDSGHGWEEYKDQVKQTDVDPRTAIDYVMAKEALLLREGWTVYVRENRLDAVVREITGNERILDKHRPTAGWRLVAAQNGPDVK